ncbi:MAG: histidine kinase [Tyzzerella sp.]|nr:histidine kinase [Tyzzerella sp.]
MRFKRVHFKYTYVKVVAIIMASLIPFTLLLSAFITIDYYNAEKRVVSANNQTMGYASAEIFNSLETMQIRLFQLFSTSEVSYFTALSMADDYAERLYYAKQIQKQLVNIEISSDYAQNIWFLTDTGDVITSSNINMETFIDEDAVFSKAFLSESGSFVYDDVLYMLVKEPVIPGMSVNMIVVEVKKDSIIADLSKPFNTESSTCHIILSEGSFGWSVVSGNSNPKLLEFATNSKTNFRETNVKFDGRKYTVASSSDAFLNLTFSALIAGNPYGEGKVLSIFLIILTIIITVVVIRMDRKLIKRIVAEPVNTLISALEHAENEQYEAISSVTNYEDFQYIADRFDMLIHKLQQGTIQLYEEKIRTQEAELKHMQAQINPHFLYNSLFTISRLSRDGENVLAGEFSNYLAKYFRYLTRTGSSFATLEREMDHLRTYINIMEFRFSNRIRTEIENYVVDSDIMIPKLIIQPLAENAFEHGLRDTLSDGEIHICLVQNDNILHIMVEDNGGSITDERLEEIRSYVYAEDEMDRYTGLYNVNKRLRIHYGSDSGLIFEKNQYHGLRVLIHIDVSEQKNVLEVLRMKGER